MRAHILVLLVVLVVIVLGWTGGRQPVLQSLQPTAPACTELNAN